MQERQASSRKDNFHLLGWSIEGNLLKLLTKSTDPDDVSDLQSIL